MEQCRIAIIGGGPAGLSTAGALKTLGLNPVVFDRDTDVGASWRRRYDRLRLHTVRRFSGLAHFPIPKRYPRYLTRDMYAEYLRDYAAHFSLEIAHACNVDRIQTQPDGANGEPRFVLNTSRGPYRAQAVVLATGMYGVPVMPNVPGSSDFRGETIHSSAYKNGKTYAGKRVLVVGIGNTGAEIVADLAEQGAAFTAISIRTYPPIVPRDFLGTPVQLFGIVLSRLPAHAADRIGALVSRIALGNLRRYGVASAQWAPFSARRIPVIDAGFVKQLKLGRIAIRPAFERLTPDGAIYADGRSEEFDAVIFATGYETGLRTMLDKGLLDDQGMPRFASGTPSPQRGIYFMGYMQSHRGLLYEIDIASRKLARIIAAGLNEAP